MTFDDIKSTPNLQERLQAVIREEYNVSYPVSDLVRRAALKPELLQLDKYEKPLYAVCMFYQCQWVKEILDEIGKDYDTNPNVRRYIATYFSQKGVTDKEGLRTAMNNAVEALPSHYQTEDTCLNFKVCKYIELAQRDEGKFSDVTDALMSNREAVIDYGGEMEQLIDDDVPIEVANSIASQNTVKRFKLAEMLAAPVRMKYEIRDTVEQSIAAGLGEYGDQYLQNKAEIRKRKEQFKMEKLQAKQEAQLNKIKQNPDPKQAKQSGVVHYGQNQRQLGYATKGHHLITLGNVCILISLIFLLIVVIVCLLRGSLLRLGFFMSIGGVVISMLGILKQSMKERGWQILSIVGAMLSFTGIIVSFM